jgi:hypothetical protein
MNRRVEIGQLDLLKLLAGQPISLPLGTGLAGESLVAIVTLSPDALHSLEHPDCHRCEQKTHGREIYTVNDAARGLHYQFDVESALAYARKQCRFHEIPDEIVHRMLIVNLGSFCADHVAHCNPDIPGLIATVYPTPDTITYVLIDGTHRTVRNYQMDRKPTFYVLSAEEAEQFITERSQP